MISLAGKVAVITGGAKGIGYAIAERFAEAGAEVALLDLEARDAMAAAEALALSHGTRCIGLAANVSRKAELAKAAETVMSRMGRFDIWVNNAGILTQYDPLTSSEVEVLDIMQVNVAGVQNGISVAAEHMEAGGVILNLASTAAWRGAGPYSASKWAVRGMTAGAAPALGARGIRIAALAPSLTETPGVEGLLQTAKGREIFDHVSARNPLGRVAEPDDIARAALFLASDLASYVTGITLPVDGGSLTAL